MCCTEYGGAQEEMVEVGTLGSRVNRWARGLCSVKKQQQQKSHGVLLVL